MSFSVTVVRTPDALSAEHWAVLRSRAPGTYRHELRLVLDDPGDELSGEELDQLLRKTLGGPEVQLSTAGIPLTQLQPGSALIHPAMVVLVSAELHRLSPVQPAQLQLCLDSGPDAGRLIPLRRGRTQIGRGAVEVSAADPQMSRREAVLEVGTAAVRLHRQAASAQSPLTVTTDETFQLGTTQCRLSVDVPAPRAQQTWPPPEEPIGAKPPESRNRMMLAFALVPLLAGIILVLVTGMWFFLLFSGASAVIALVIFFTGRRQRLTYRRLIREAAQRWSTQSHTALCSPGHLVEQLRSTGTHRVYAGASADPAPAVRIGTGTCTAQLDTDQDAELKNDDAAANSAVGITLNAGEFTTISGPQRCAQRLIHWTAIQLALNPLHPQVVLVGTAQIAELRDVAQLEGLSAGEFLVRLDAGHDRVGSPRVLLLAEPDHLHCAQRAANAGWHVVTVGGDLEKPGWQINLEQGRVERRGVVGIPVVHAADLRYEGLAVDTLREHLRLALAHGASDTGPQEIPQICTHRLQEPMLTGSSAEHLIAVLGRHSSGTQSLDLIEDGPHVLIAGTSGSGKSELLKTMLISLCARYAPNELGMVLIDFKGGAAFHQLSRLEHSLGLVTDLSQAAAERTLEGIRSELLRREKLFMDSEAGDYVEYRQMNPDRELSRILVVIDEFRIFSHELPDQMDELMRLATLGRSLGLHLLLSTQRPQGVVTADIRANIGASICLRVRSEEESRDVIGSPLAAGISRSVPGRAAMRLPGEPPQLFQTAQLSSARSVTLRPEAVVFDTPLPTGFRDCVAAVRKAASAPEYARRHTPLLPPLPETLSSSDRLACGEDALLLGRIDDPVGQLQQDLVLDLREPKSLLLLGEAGSGAAEASSALAAQALTAGSEADVYLLDGDRSLAALAEQPRVGSWLTEEDLPEVEHLLQRLCEELADRRVRSLRHDGTGACRPLMVLVSGYAQWHAAAYSGLQSLDHLLGTLAAEGPQAGISVMICGGRELSIGKLAARVPTRIYCPLGTSEEIRYLWPKLRSTAPVPGRGVLVDPHTPAPGMSVQLVTEKMQTALSGAQSCSAPEISVHRLPELLSCDQLQMLRNPADHPADFPTVGIKQFTGTPVTLRLGPVNLILGGRGLGKTSCLKLLRQQLPDAIMLRPGDTPPAQLPQVLLVDDATACSAEQHSYIHQASSAGVTIVAADPPSASVFSRLPWAHPARTEGSNLILSPTSRSHTDAFPTITPLLPRSIPGRAVHLLPEGPTIVQWAMPR